jgi:predicted DsbA family dithiol-disulfide isomerase
MLVEIWSDVVCPWCYIGKRRFEAALGRFDHEEDVELVWRAFELDPGAPAERSGSPVEHLARKYGMPLGQARATYERITELAATEGLDYHLDEARRGNSFDAHRLIHLATAAGSGDAMKERLLRAYFVEAEPIGDPETLARLAADVGLDRDEVEAVLAGDRFADEVRADEQRAAALDITGVPFFLVDGRVGVSGAQDPDLLLRMLDRAWSTSEPTADPRGDVPPGDTCAV